ncbi:MAG: 1-acyl-sn-glycerol-3-phosphate acyltransferase [Bacteroidales bacterium]|nr:1-acyl-sn-glycerol-3-phosphate acyltransferase [Bacteroidales bacterium]
MKTKTISGFILKCILRWEVKDNFPNHINSSIVIFAPHTSYFDALYGKLAINEYGINHIFLSKKELFYFPMNLLMKWYGSIPVRGVKGENAIIKVTKILKEDKFMHVVLSPEGKLAKTNKWDKGFYYMASRANVPIIVASIDYKKKEIEIKGIIDSQQDINLMMQQINNMYKNVTAKYPEKFQLYENK